jgi:hypothetical protein
MLAFESISTPQRAYQLQQLATAQLWQASNRRSAKELRKTYMYKHTHKNEGRARPAAAAALAQRLPQALQRVPYAPSAPHPPAPHPVPLPVPLSALSEAGPSCTRQAPPPQQPPQPPLPSTCSCPICRARALHIASTSLQGCGAAVWDAELLAASSDAWSGAAQVLDAVECELFRAMPASMRLAGRQAGTGARGRVACS